MSVEAMAWALWVPVGGNAKVVLLGLANHAHHDGTKAFPSYDTLAVYAHCDRSTAKRNARKLEEEGWVERDGVGPRGEVCWRLCMERRGGAADPGGHFAPGGASAQEGGAPVPPEPSIEPSSRSSASSARASLFGWVNDDELPNDFGIPEGMVADAAELIRRRTKVGTRIVDGEEMVKAAAALAEFNRQADSSFGLGAHLTAIVGRVRERPSYDAQAHVRLVQSAWRLRWWERNGRGRRPTPAVIYGNANVFEQVVQDAADEKKGKSIEDTPERRGRFTREG